VLLNAKGEALISTSLWTRNLAVVRRRWPAIAQRLAAVSSAPYTLSDTPDPAMIVAGIQIASGFDRLEEARCQASALPDEVTKCWVYGHGQGDLPRLLLTEPGFTFALVLLNLEVTKAVFETSDQTDWLSSPRMQLFNGEVAHGVNEPFISCHGEVRLCAPRTLHLRDRLLAKLNANHNAANFENRRDADEANIAVNKQLLDEDVRSLVGAVRGPAVVVAGGPSIDKLWLWLQAWKGTIVCASTMLIPLKNHGITPHYVCDVDTDAEQIERYREVDASLKAATLVYSMAVSSAIPASWPGPRRVATGLFMDGTVTHAAIDLAVRLGSREVFLVGCDFCYPGNKSHAEGTALPTTEHGQLQTVNGLGDTVTTDPNLAHYHRRTEDYIEAHPEVRWWKVGREGVSLRGAQWLT
jgi:hypothetical protein